MPPLASPQPGARLPDGDSTNAPPGAVATVSAPSIAPPPRRRLAALTAIGALMVALPMAQLLRYQADELDALRLEQAGLDPMSRAVEVQAGVIDHGDLAAQVLRGRAESEPQRVQHQRLVDSRVAALTAELASNIWPRARIESDALRNDWLALALALNTHRIDAAGSDSAHRLLVEQSLQVIDHLGTAGVRAGGFGADPNEKATELLRQTRSLPREMWRQAQAAEHPPTAKAASGPAAADLQARFRQLHKASTHLLTTRIDSIELQRLALSLALLLLAAAAAWIVWQLARNPRKSVAAVATPAKLEADAGFAVRPRRPHDAAGDVLHRMRRNPIERRGAEPAPSTLPPQD